MWKNSEILYFYNISRYVSLVCENKKFKADITYQAITVNTRTKNEKRNNKF